MIFSFRIQALFFIIFLSVNSFGQKNEDFTLISRYSFYSDEDTAEMLLHLPAEMVHENISVKLKQGNIILYEWTGRPRTDILRLPFNLHLISDSSTVEAETTRAYRPGEKYIASADPVILPHKSNEVKTDRLTGGLIVNGRPFFPFGFYCYSPVHPALPEEEVVKGFNMISPYQRIAAGNINERKAYMDRCAQLGMKVHYNLLSVTGGGGVGSTIDSITEGEKRELLINEIKIFMDHPALLAWYISDEPTGNKVSPETLEDIYRFVKKTDPWHPVSIVFMAPFKSAVDYANALDIVMADPYPVPDLPPSMVGDVARSLKKSFTGKSPVWIVPQVFGGGEHWRREPTYQEVRSMTWQSVIQGATGIQYFVRNGLNSFPKSTATWGECGKIAQEINVLKPWLLSDEETFPVTSLSKNILVTSRFHNGQLVILVVNRVNEPQRAEIRIEKAVSGKAEVMFENRSVPLTGGFLADIIAPFGSQAYKIDITPPAKTFEPYKRNLIIDQGFEDLAGLGVPVSCYARTGNDRGATYFLDGAEHVEGNYSLRLVTPTEKNGVSLRFFPVTVIPGNSYMISVWAKSDPDQRLLSEQKQEAGVNKESAPQYVEIGLGEIGSSRFIPGKEWKQFVAFVTIPADTVQKKKVNITLKMPGQGVAWFDMLQMIEDPLKRQIP
jgi:hypothetical protein